MGYPEYIWYLKQSPKLNIILFAIRDNTNLDTRGVTQLELLLLFLDFLNHGDEISMRYYTPSSEVTFLVRMGTGVGTRTSP